MKKKKSAVTSSDKLWKTNDLKVILRDNLCFFVYNIFGDFVKKSFMLFLKSFVISSICLCIILGLFYWYVQTNVVPAENEVDNVPYAQQKPDNKGVLLEIGVEKTFFYLDFQNTLLSVSINPPLNSQEIYGYPLDFTVTSDYDLLVFIIDYFGGAEITANGETLRYTGLQICETIKRTTDKKLRRDIIADVCKKIALQGVTTEFFMEIIQKSKTEMRLVDCYFWYEDIGDMCQRVEFID